MDRLIAIPSNNPGGLNASVAQNFGHCDLYTLVNIKEGKIGKSNCNTYNSSSTGWWHGVYTAYGI